MSTKTFLFVWFALYGSACAGPTASPDTPLINVGRPCSLVLDPNQTDTRSLVLDTAMGARERDLRCGPPSRQRRVCRALWLAEQLDPVPMMASGSMPSGDEFELLVWVLNDGAEASTGDLALAFRELAFSTIALSMAASEADLASIVLQRGAAPVVDALRQAESSC